MNKKRVIPLILPFVLLVLSELFLFFPNIFFINISFGLIFIMLSVRYLSKDNEEKFWPSYLVLPSFLWLGFSSYSYLSSNSLLIQIFLILMTILMFAYFKNIYYYLSAKKVEKEKNLDNYSFNYSFLIIFTLYSSIYILPQFINMSFVYVFVFMTLVLFLLFWQNVLFLKFDNKAKVVFSLISAALLSQLSWVLYLLPLKPSVSAFTLSLFFYFLITLVRLNIKGDLNKKTIRWPLFFTLILLLLVLFSASWI